MIKKKFSYKRPFIGLLCLCALNACTNEALSVRSDYLSHETLASYHINTPDPRTNNPPIGQRLLISWSLPKKYQNYPDLHLCATIRYRNREEVIKEVAIRRNFGTYIYCLLNEDYCEKGGIATYKVQLKSGNCFLEEWRHQLWAELIHFDVANINDDL